MDELCPGSRVFVAVRDHNPRLMCYYVRLLRTIPASAWWPTRYEVMILGPLHPDDPERAIIRIIQKAQVVPSPVSGIHFPHRFYEPDGSVRRGLLPS